MASVLEIPVRYAAVASSVIVRAFFFGAFALVGDSWVSLTAALTSMGATISSNFLFPRISTLGNAPVVCMACFSPTALHPYASDRFLKISFLFSVCFKGSFRIGDMISHISDESLNGCAVVSLEGVQSVPPLLSQVARHRTPQKSVSMSIISGGALEAACLGFFRKCRLTVSAVFSSDLPSAQDPSNSWPSGCGLPSVDDSPLLDLNFSHGFSTGELGESSTGLSLFFFLLFPDLAVTTGGGSSSIGSSAAGIWAITFRDAADRAVAERFLGGDWDSLLLSMDAEAPVVVIDRYRSAALVNVLVAVEGIGAALLPLRRVLLGGFWTTSSIDGRSGEDEITIKESYCIILEGDDNLEL